MPKDKPGSYTAPPVHLDGSVPLQAAPEMPAERWPHNDIVQRLRGVYCSTPDGDDGWTPEIVEEAADVIEDLRATLIAAQSELQNIHYDSRPLSEPGFDESDLGKQITEALQPVISDKSW